MIELTLKCVRQTEGDPTAKASKSSGYSCMLFMACRPGKGGVQLPFPEQAFDGSIPPEEHPEKTEVLCARP